MNDVSPKTAVAPRPTKPVDAVRNALERMKPQLELALPRHLTADRLLRVAMTAVQNTPKLLDCDRTSLFGAIMTCAQLGLEPDGVLGQAYLVPFAGKVQFIPGYKGLISLARNSGDVTSIAAHEVRENDIFEFDFASGDPPRHTFDIRQPRGEVIAFYAIARFTDGSFHWDMMTRDEVDRIRDGSSGYKLAKSRGKEKDSPWGEHYVEMGKKTLIRRIAKYLPLSVQKAAAIADSYDAGKHMSLDGHGDLVIEGESELAPETSLPSSAQGGKLDRFEAEHAVSDRPEPFEVIGVDGEPAEYPTAEAAVDAYNAALDAAEKARGAAGLAAIWESNGGLMNALDERGFVEIEKRLSAEYGRRRQAAAEREAPAKSAKGAGAPAPAPLPQVGPDGMTAAQRNRDPEFWEGERLTISAPDHRAWAAELHRRLREARTPHEIDALRDDNGEQIDALPRADREDALGRLIDRAKELASLG